MKSTLVTTLFCMYSMFVFAQETDSVALHQYRHNINVNFMGGASLASVNYEYLTYKNERLFVAAQIGAGYNEEWNRCLFGCGEIDKYLIIPHQLTLNFGKNKNKLELGIGGAAVVGSKIENYYLYPIVGYRLHPITRKRINFRLFASYPYRFKEPYSVLFIPVGLSYGFCF